MNMPDIVIWPLSATREIEHSMAAPQSRVTFFTIGNQGYFVGVAGLVGSLRRTGHDGEIVVLDTGFTQRQLVDLRKHCTVAPRPSEQVFNPSQFKAFASTRDPEGVAVIIDSDMIVTRSLAPLIHLAESGKIVAFADPEPDRWFAEWEELFELPTAPRRQTYVNAGFILFSTEHWPDLLRWFAAACSRIMDKPSLYEGAGNVPWAQSDQDALNAVLMSRIPQDALAVFPSEEAPAATLLWQNAVAVLDETTLACRVGTHKTWLIHAAGTPKPWEKRAWYRVRNHAYVRLLRRLLHDPAAPLSVPASQLPLWLRAGTAGRIAAQWLNVLNSPFAVRVRNRPAHMAAALLPHPRGSR
jgi:hypothetical protein